MNSIGASTGTQDANAQNITINGTEVTGKEGINQLVTGSLMGGNGITSISYTVGNEQVTIKGDDIIEELEKSITMLAEYIKEGKVPEDVLEEICQTLSKACQDFFMGFWELMVEVVAGEVLSDEKTEEDIVIQEAADALIDALLNSKVFSDSDMRELMKLLIQAFCAFMTTQRAINLNTMQNIMAAFEEKIRQMEKARDKNYEAAMTQAKAQLIGACIQVFASLMSVGLAACSADATRKGTFNAETGKFDAATEKILKNLSVCQTFCDALGNLAGIFTALGGMSAAESTYQAKTAEIKAAIQDAALELFRKMQEAGTEFMHKLFDIVNSLVQMILQLVQSISSTEQQIAQQA